MRSMASGPGAWAAARCRLRHRRLPRAAARGNGRTSRRPGLEYNPGAAARAAAKSGVPVVGRHDQRACPSPMPASRAVVSLDVLCHAAVDPAQALAEMLRVLAPGGVLIVNLPAFDWLRSAHDIRVQNARRFTAGDRRARCWPAAGLAAGPAALLEQPAAADDGAAPQGAGPRARRAARMSPSFRPGSTVACMPSPGWSAACWPAASPSPPAVRCSPPRSAPEIEDLHVAR